MNEENKTTIPHTNKWTIEYEEERERGKITPILEKMKERNCHFVYIFFSYDSDIYVHWIKLK